MGPASLPPLPPQPDRPQASAEVMEAARQLLAEMEADAKKTAVMSAEIVEEARRARRESHKLRETQGWRTKTGSSKR